MADIILSEPTLKEDQLSVGQTLKAARLKRGLTLEQISKQLFIPKRLLTYLEEDDKCLVCDVYTLGFLKLYAQYLELNGKNFIEKFKEESGHHSPSSQLSFPAPLPGRGIPSLWILAFSFFMLIAFVIGWKWIGDYTASPLHLPEITFDLTPLDVQETTLTEPPIEGKTTPIEDTNEEFEPTNLLLKAGYLEGDYPLLEERMFPIFEKSGNVEQDILINSEKWLEQQFESH